MLGEETLPFNQRRITEQDKFTYSPFDKVFEKQIKTIEDQGYKLIKEYQGHGKNLLKKWSL